jgi:hypothetical protein
MADKRVGAGTAVAGERLARMQLLKQRNSCAWQRCRLLVDL